MRRKCIYVRLVQLWGARAKHAVIMRMPSSLLPRRAAYFSHGITPGYRSWLPLWPREAVLALLKTRNQLNAYAERWVRSVKEECLSRLILFGEASLRHALTQYVAHFHHERNHQGKGNVLLFPAVSPDAERTGPIQCRERLGGLLKYYTCEAA